jgi:hypothetical protein
MAVILSCEPAYIYLHYALSLATTQNNCQRTLIAKAASRLMRDRQGFVCRQTEVNYLRVVRIAIKAQVIFCKEPADLDAAHELLLELEKLDPLERLVRQSEE